MTFMGEAVREHIDSTWVTHPHYYSHKWPLNNWDYLHSQCVLADMLKAIQCSYPSIRKHTICAHTKWHS